VLSNLVTQPWRLWLELLVDDELELTDELELLEDIDDEDVPSQYAKAPS